MNNNNPPNIPATPGQIKIMETVQKELFPQVEILKEIIVEIQTCKISYQLHSLKLKGVEDRYEKNLKSFFEVVKKLETPDTLFEGVEGGERNILDYFQLQGAFRQSISDGMTYVEIIDRTLDRKSGAIQNNRTFVISLVALLVGFISIFASNI